MDFQPAYDSYDVLHIKIIQGFVGVDRGYLGQTLAATPKAHLSAAVPWQHGHVKVQPSPLAHWSIGTDTTELLKHVFGMPTLQNQRHPFRWRRHLEVVFNACFYIFVWSIISYFLCSLLVERATLHWKLIQFALSNWIPSVSNQRTPEKAFDRCPHCYSLAVAGIAFAIRCRNAMDSFSWWNTRSESFVSHKPKATYTEMATSWRNSWTKVLEFVLPTISLHSTIHTIPFRQRRGGLRLLGTSHPKSWKEQFHSSGSAMVSPILFPFWWPEFGSKTAIGVGNFYPAFRLAIFLAEFGWGQNDLLMEATLSTIS